MAVPAKAHVCAYCKKRLRTGPVALGCALVFALFVVLTVVISNASSTGPSAPTEPPAPRANTRPISSHAPVQKLLDIHELLRLKAGSDGARLRALFPTAKVTYEKATDEWTAAGRDRGKVGFGRDAALDMVTISRFKGELVCISVMFKKPAPDRVAALALVGLNAAGTAPKESKVMLRGRWFGLDGIYRVDVFSIQGADPNGDDCDTVQVYPSQTALLKAEAADEADLNRIIKNKRR